MSRGVGHRRGWDPALLWLWCRLVAIAPIRPLAWEPQYASGVALKKAKKKEKDLFYKSSAPQTSGGYPLFHGLLLFCVLC